MKKLLPELANLGLMALAITHDLGRGVTGYRGFGGMSGGDRNILYCVVTRLEVGNIKRIVREIDPHALFHPLSGAEGGVVKRRVH